MNLSTATRPIALLGHPVEHSHSPRIHNYAFEQTNQPYVYIACDVAEEDLNAAVRGLKALGFRGANVTIPHKRAALELMDELTPQAEATRAINTISCEGEAGRVRLVGDNTDVTGFIASVQPVIEDVMHKPALVLGSGGAARAVVYALATTLRASEVIVAARSPEKARRMLAEMQLADHVEVVPFETASVALERSSFVVNATPLGMHPDDGASAVADPSRFNDGQIVYDLVYHPRRTQMLRDAEERGARTINGIEMLIGQAAAAFTRWTGVEMPIDRIRRLLS